MRFIDTQSHLRTSGRTCRTRRLCSWQSGLRKKLTNRTDTGCNRHNKAAYNKCVLYHKNLDLSRGNLAFVARPVYNVRTLFGDYLFLGRVIMANKYLLPVFNEIYGENFSYADFNQRMEMQKQSIYCKTWVSL